MKNLLGAVAFLLMWVQFNVGVQAQTRTPVEIRVGITEYQHLETSYETYRQIFQRLADTVKGPVTFKYAIGTYEDVTDWYNKRLIDVAVLSAIPVADLLSSAERDPVLLDKIKKSYVGSLSPRPPSAQSPTDAGCGQGEFPRSLYEDLYTPEEQRQKSASTSFYRTVCVVPINSKLNDFSQILEQRDQNTLEFLFVRPFSASGYIIPSYFLGEHGVDINAQAYQFTYQHRNTLERLMKSPDGTDTEDEGGNKGKTLVGFVQDKTTYCAKDPQRKYFKLIKTPELTDNDEYLIPHEAVLVNYYLEAENPKKFENIKKTMLELLSAVGAGDEQFPFSFQRVDEEHTLEKWIDTYKAVTRAFQHVPMPRSLPYRFTLDEIIADLAKAKKRDDERHASEGKGGPQEVNGKAAGEIIDGADRPFRLALVLSGGGAKCAYQAGAIREIERKLKENNIDIDLVVGTSGGAINALFVALGVTRDEVAKERLEETWTGFEQRDFFQPSWAFNIIFGLCFGLVQAFVITTATLLFGRNFDWSSVGKILCGVVLAEALTTIYLDYFHILTSGTSWLILWQVIIISAVAEGIRLLRRRVKDWWRQAGWIMLVLSALEFFIKLFQSPIAYALATIKNHWVHHSVMIVTLFSSWSAPVPLLLGVAMLVTGYKRIPVYNWHAKRALLVRALSVAVFFMAVALGLYSLLKMDTPSNPAGIEDKFVSDVPKLLGAMGDNLDPGVCQDDRAKSRTPLERISCEIAKQPGVFRRDMIITASRLPLDDRYESAPYNYGRSHGEVRPNQLPDDLYFYYGRDAGDDSHGTSRRYVPATPPGNQFISLRDDENQDKLLDVVIGSGTIYPLFPYRQLGSMKVDEKTVDGVRIIDGGFIHNSPVDAAVKWGASHIILIEASPTQKPFAPHNFFQNILVAFNYLFSQAQHLDTLSRGSVEMFELRPTSQCDKLNRDFNCGDAPAPDMDTFDFSPLSLREAYVQGIKDVNDSRALFTRVSGQPLFRTVKPGWYDAR